MNEPKTSTTVYAFAKFGKRAHLEKLQRGLLHMKTVRYFRELDASRGWGDPLEGLTAHLQPRSVRITLGLGEKTVEIPSEDLAGPVLIHNYEYDLHHVFCLAAALPEHAEAHVERGEPLFSRKFLEDPEKDHVLLIKVMPFLERLKEGAAAAGTTVRFAPVFYYDEDAFHGSTSPFHKKASLRWQQEFRILLDPSERDFFELQIPSLEDVSYLGAARDFVENFKMVQAPEHEPGGG